MTHLGVTFILLAMEKIRKVEQIIGLNELKRLLISKNAPPPPPPRTHKPNATIILKSFNSKNDSEICKKLFTLVRRARWNESIDK